MDQATKAYLLKQADILDMKAQGLDQDTEIAQQQADNYRANAQHNRNLANGIRAMVEAAQ